MASNAQTNAASPHPPHILAWPKGARHLVHVAASSGEFGGCSSGGFTALSRQKLAQAQRLNAIQANLETCLSTGGRGLQHGDWHQNVTVAIFLDGACTRHAPMIASHNGLVGNGPIKKGSATLLSECWVLIAREIPTRVLQEELMRVCHIAGDEELTAA